MVYVLLGLGLNIVVGYAGLLDLGYVAFFAFGAYSDRGAHRCVPQHDHRGGRTGPLRTSQLLRGRLDRRALAACLGLLIGAPVLRLRGDYLAIVTLGLGEIVSVITASKWAQPLIGGPQGMRGVTKARDLRVQPPGQPAALLLPRARLRPARALRLLATRFVARRPSVERDARGRAGRRRDGDQHDQVQAPGVRDGWRDRFARRRAFRGQHRVAHACELRDPRVDHGAGRRDPGRTRAACPASWSVPWC